MKDELIGMGGGRGEGGTLTDADILDRQERRRTNRQTDSKTDSHRTDRQTPQKRWTDGQTGDGGGGKSWEFQCATVRVVYVGTVQ